MATSSNIWIFFHLCLDENYAQCDLCPAKISRGRQHHTTSAMWNHLKSKHFRNYQELKGTFPPSAERSQVPPETLSDDNGDGDNWPLPESQASGSSSIASITEAGSAVFSVADDAPIEAAPRVKRRLLSTSKLGTLPNLFDQIKTFRAGDKRYSRITRLIAEMICTDNQPLSVVEDKGFKKLVNHFEPRYVIPSRKYFAQNIIPEMYEEQKARVVALLHRTDFVGVTTDMWTSTCGDDYLSLTVHFLDQDFKYNHLCLDCIPFRGVADTVTAIEDFVTDTLCEWNLSHKVVCIMRDNGANMVAALTRSMFDHLPCVAHTFQLILKDELLTKTEITTILATCRSIVGYYKHSPKAMKILRATQARLGVKQHRLIQDEPTQWNSQLHMLARMLEQKEAVLLSASDLKFPVDLSAHQWALIEEVVHLLGVFDKATLLASSSKVTISEIIPLVNSIMRTLQSLKSRLAPMESFIHDLHESLKKCYSSAETEHLYALATLLDPRFKGNAFLNKDNIEQAKAALLMEMSTTSGEACCSDHEQATQQVRTEVHTSETEGNDSLCSFYSNLLEEPSSMPGHDLPLEEELNAYLAETRLPTSTDIFMYWKENQKYPHLRQLCKKFLITPPSTVLSERLFSTSGLIVDKKGSRLDPERVRMLVFLNKNLQ